MCYCRIWCHMWWIGRLSRLSDSQQYAIVTPLLKRPGVDTTNLTNYRPVSDVTFTSKIVAWSMPLPSNFISTWRKTIYYRATSPLTTRQQRPYCVSRLCSDSCWCTTSDSARSAGSLDGVRLRRPPLYYKLKWEWKFAWSRITWQHNPTIKNADDHQLTNLSRSLNFIEDRKPHLPPPLCYSNHCATCNRLTTSNLNGL